MNLAEIQKAASDAYRTAHDSHSPSSSPNQSMHERGIAAVVAAVAQAVLEPALKDELASLWNHAVDMRMQTDWAWIINELLERRLETLLKPADERVAVVRAIIDEHFNTWLNDREAKRAETVLKIIAACDAKASK